jgi:glycine hydroxymethyltransferase
MILCRDSLRKKIDSRTFPGWQGGPLMHTIAGKAVALKIAASAEFAERQRRTRVGVRAVAEEMLAAGSTCSPVEWTPIERRPSAPSSR